MHNNTKITQRFIPRNPFGGENPTKILEYRIRPSTMNNPKNKTNNFLAPVDCYTLPLAHLLECEACTNEGGTSIIYTHQVSDNLN